MRLYMAAGTKYAVEVVKNGFIDSTRLFYDSDELKDARASTMPGSMTPPESLPEPTSSRELCEFRYPYEKATTSDFVLSIEVPDDFATEHEGKSDSPEDESSLRVFWLRAEEANQYRDSMKILYAKDGEEVPPDLVGK